MTSELVLVVDDEPDIVQLARLYLEREGYRIEAVGEGPGALKAVEELRPALVVLDVMLPGLDGFEVCRQLRAANNPVPIVMVTARDEDIDKIVGLELGADDYLSYPQISLPLLPTRPAWPAFIPPAMHKNASGFIRCASRMPRLRLT
jgi:two-component system alkaline phosphatase synthesis response regulator PhoP